MHCGDINILIEDLIFGIEPIGPINYNCTFSAGVLHGPVEADAGVVHLDPGPSLAQPLQGALHPVPVLGRAVDTHPLTAPVPLAEVQENGTFFTKPKRIQRRLVLNSLLHTNFRKVL